MTWYKKSQVEEDKDNRNVLPKEDFICPFCKQTDFDLMGLKIHLERGHCDIYNSIDTSLFRNFL